MQYFCFFLDLQPAPIRSSMSWWKAALPKSPRLWRRSTSPSCPTSLRWISGCALLLQPITANVIVCNCNLHNFTLNTPFLGICQFVRFFFIAIPPLPLYIISTFFLINFVFICIQCQCILSSTRFRHIPLSFPSTFGQTLAISLCSERDARPTMLCCLLSLVQTDWISASGNELHQTVPSLDWMSPWLAKQTVTNGSRPDTGTHLQSSMWPWTDGPEREDVGKRIRNRGRSGKESSCENKRKDGRLWGWRSAGHTGWIERELKTKIIK